MLDPSKHQRQFTQQPMVGPHCEHLFDWHRTQDDKPVTRPVQRGTSRLRRQPSVLHSHDRGKRYLEAGALVTLQFLPSGICMPVSLDEPAILGRLSFDENQTFDLARVGAYEHGVSRQHCSLRRDGARLIVTDLNSMNGTYLNGDRLIPWQDYVVEDGSRLILGSLHVAIHFVKDASA